MGSNQRRVALRGWLRGRSGATARQAAEHFGVTERTILRDITALRDQGDPIVGTPGPGGGFRLLPSAKLPPVRLTVEEVVGLMLSLEMARRAAPDTPFSLSGRDAAERLVATLPADRASVLRRLFRRIVVGDPSSGNVKLGLGTVSAANLLGTFELGFTHRQLLQLAYVDRHGQATARQIEPHGLLLRPPAWYIVAYDRMREGTRFFRMDRVTEARVLDERFDPRPESWFDELMRPTKDGVPQRGPANL